jgi:alpha-galactosidase
MSNPSLLRLDGNHVTAIIEYYTDGQAPLWRYWGPKLHKDAGPRTAMRDTRPLPSFSLDYDQPLSVFPGFGVGWFGQPALLAHRAGQDWTFQAQRCNISQADNHSVAITMTDDIAQIEAAVTLTLNPQTDVMTLSSQVTNIGEGLVDVQWLAAGTIPLPQDAVNVRSYSGRHNNEFIAVDDVLSRSMWRRENRRGLTSHDCFPGAIVTCADGTVYGAQFAWSGNHAQCIEWMDDGGYQWQMGEWLAPGEVRLAAAESIQTPEILASCANSADAVAQNFHGEIRRRMTWPGGKMKPRPVHLNTWEGFYFNHDLDALKSLADSAAEIGIERFVLDDGWFARRNDDTSSLGDWWPDTSKYPDGLKPLADYVSSLGMEFGLWVEPEMVNPDSDLFRAHPDWALHIPGRAHITARNQLVLDMTLPLVQDYLYGKIAGLLDSLPITYLKWDHNRDLTAAGAQPRYRAQVMAAYALMARIRCAFPNVEIEACAGGGGRIDAGIIRHTHRFWTSDCIDAVSRTAMQRAFLQFMPPEIMGSHVGTAPAHSTGRAQSMDFRAATALPGHFGVELDVRQVQGEERETLRHWIAQYKAHREQIHGGKMWQGEAGDNIHWQAFGSSDDMLLFVTRMQPMGQKHMPTLRLPMVDAGKAYHVDDIQYDGAWLNAVGLSLPHAKAETCQMIRVTAI